jgi:hypothetical protein
MVSPSSIWLEHCCDDLSSLEFNKGKELRFEGFDISAAQFPKDGKGKYYVQDLLEPFPAEFHGTYDLVHARYLTLAIKTDRYLDAVKNLLTLLSKIHLQFPRAEVTG